MATARSRAIAHAEGVVHLRDPDGDVHLVFGAHGQEGPQEKVPRADEGDDRERRGDAPVHRQVDAEQELKFVGAVDHRCLAEILGHGIEKLFVDDDRHRRDELRHDDARVAC